MADSVDRRLLGTWQSDRRRTFQHYRPRPSLSAAKLRRFKAIFGHLLIRWTAKRCYWKSHPDDERWEFARYELIASDDRSVIVRLHDGPLFETPGLRQIVFDDNHYWVLPGLAPTCRKRFGVDN